jgi:uncharacterized membrane protein YdjX (TVP38/TMEM64 family)
VTAVLGCLAWLFVHYDLHEIDPQALAEQMRGAGSIGPLLLFGLFVLQCIVSPLPSEPVMMAAGFVYGHTWGLVLGWAGVVCGAAACFLLARSMGRPVVHRFAPARRVAALEEYLRERGRLAAVASLLFIRLFAVSSFDVVSYGCGLLRFPFAWFLFATAVGVIPKVFAFTYLGASVGPRPAWLDVTIAVGTLGILALPVAFRRWRQPLAIGSSAAREGQIAQCQDQY